MKKPKRKYNVYIEHEWFDERWDHGGYGRDCFCGTTFAVSAEAAIRNIMYRASSKSKECYGHQFTTDVRHYYAAYLEGMEDDDNETKKFRIWT